MQGVALFSGGLDSLLALKIVQEQNITLEIINFSTVFFNSDKKLQSMAKKYGFKLRIIDVSEEYFEILKKPTWGYGKGANPCVDCKMFMLKKASKYGDFLVTGEVVGQRPMSQLKDRLLYIEKHTNLKGKILRPLSAKILAPTIPEQEGVIDREKLLDINGRSRKRQLELAKIYKIDEYITSAGCLLTKKHYGQKVFDLIKHDQLNLRNVKLLQTGRHFRKDNNKIIVGKNREENHKLISIKSDNEIILEAKTKGPTTLLQGSDIEIAAALTAYYSKDNLIKIDDKIIEAKQIDKEEVYKLLIVDT